MATAGLWMLAVVAVTLIATGLPAWIVLIGVAVAFSGGGLFVGAFTLPILTAVPARILGLLENDLLQALPLYVLMGALLNHLPLAQTVFRATSRALERSGAGTALAGLGLGVLLAPMNGSVGASVATLGRTVFPRLDAAGMPAEKSAALVCVASTLGVVVPPSLVLILLSDAMMRAHTEALHLTGRAMRIINTQDVFVGALVPAAILLAMYSVVTWVTCRAKTGVIAAAAPRPTAREWATAGATAAFVAGLLIGVTLGYLYAVEAAAAGGVVLVLFGLATRTLTRTVLREVLLDTMVVTGALFALLVGATVFTLILRAYGTDRWVAAALVELPGGAPAALAVVLASLALCALVLDAFEMIFVVIPVVMPPLLTQIGDATWVAVLTLLILQASFLAPPFGYAVLMVRNSVRRALSARGMARALAPYLAAQLAVLALTLAWPMLVWHRNPSDLGSSTAAASTSEDERPRTLEQQLERNADDDAKDAASDPAAKPR
ncbi:MAG: TRAP transporter large permease subunit [Aromatoleum sp.]|nr:TRAP transporter large permease subunit [Aromatoleum sp.]